MNQGGEDYSESELAEYASVRDEILQLNRQQFAVGAGAIGINIAILGWMFSSSIQPAGLWWVPIIGVVSLFLGNILVINRDRLAHRLAIFQIEFIEVRNPGIAWGRTYFRFRTHYEPRGIEKLLERIVNSNMLAATIMQVVDITIMLSWRRDAYGLVLAAVALLILLGQLVFTRMYASPDSYAKVTDAMRLAKKDMEGAMATPHPR